MIFVLGGAHMIFVLGGRAYSEGVSSPDLWNMDWIVRPNTSMPFTQACLWKNWESRNQSSRNSTSTGQMAESH